MLISNELLLDEAEQDLLRALRTVREARDKLRAAQAIAALQDEFSSDVVDNIIRELDRATTQLFDRLYDVQVAGRVYVTDDRKETTR